MKIKSNTMMWVQNARYVVTNSGVKLLGKDNVSGNYVLLNLSRQVRQHSLLNLIAEQGFGKQYV